VDTTYKTVPFELTELKASDGGWQFSGYASTFGTVDQGGDVVMRGAFDTSLTARKKRPLLWQHDLREPIGVEVTLKPDDKGLFGTWKVVDTARGTDAHKLLKSGAIDSMSIGYVPTEVEFDDVGTRLLKSVDLLECSVVSLPMNEQALVTHVKAPVPPRETLSQALERLLKIDQGDSFENVLAQVTGFLKSGVEMAEALHARRAEERRKLTDAHVQAIEDLVAEAKDSAARLEGLVLGQRETAEATAGDLKFRLELHRRLRSFRARG
jgi:HK97 family phage prohead protease